MLLRELVTTSAAVAATRSRTRKTTVLSALLRAHDAVDRALAVAYLTGTVPQGRIGIGYVAVGTVEVTPAAEPSLRLRDVDACLREVADTTGTGSRQRREALLTSLFARATAQEQDFLGRLLLGELRHGALDGVMVTAIADAADVAVAAVRRAYMLSDDLTAVTAAALSGGEEALGAFRLRVLHPIQPMLASTAADIADAVDPDTPQVADAKLDGVRVQLHRDGDRVAVYTRSLRDITADVPGIVAAARALPVASVILDGEAISLRSDGRPEPFQVTMQRLGDDDGDGAVHDATLVCFFDCLHHDGVDLIDAPLRDRLAVLDEVVPAAQVVARHPVGAVDDAAAFFERTVADGFEGVVVKALESTYAAGRRGAAWRKVKPSWTLDLVVLAVEWGSGRRRAWLSNLHLGARDPHGGFVMLGKTFKGLTDELLEWQTHRFLELETHRTGHVVHVAPVQVVEVAVDGVQTSRRYPGGVALRFARVKRYRSDKRADEADTLATVRTLGSLPNA
ncbi:MAG: ATP-dependent DNA ligase [Actinobacteria bacterium]|nr:ATP-dependent DNA ligase [Actinomycetota bacterium]